jgi:predicted PhzF superfamily epimerase YddE/YHI9
MFRLKFCKEVGERSNAVVMRAFYITAGIDEDLVSSFSRINKILSL